MPDSAPVIGTSMRVAQVALNAAAFGYDRLYSYSVPKDCAAVRAGMRVAVPFGNGNRRRMAMVLQVGMVETAVSAEPPQRMLKPLAALLDTEPVLTDELLELVTWLHDHTFCTWYDAVRAVLPGGMQMRLQECYMPVAPPLGVSLTTGEENVLRLLQCATHPQERDALLQSDGNAEKQAVLDALLEKGCLVAVSEGKQRIGDSTQKLLRLTAAFVADEAAFHPTPKQQSVIAVLRTRDTLSAKECAYAAGVSTNVVANLIKAGIAEPYEMEQLRVPRDAVVTISPADTVLAPQQQAAYDTIVQPILSKQAAAFLLYGVTGSGKTAVFEQLIARTLQEGRQALLLIPEIALTPQIVAYFQARFGNQVALIHSGLSLGQRLDTDKLIRRGEVSIVIGTRSAVFAPLPRLGLVILDEEGEHSYKSEQAPRYHAAEVARARCHWHQAVLVLASATPSLESRYLADRGVYRMVRLTERYRNAPLPAVSIVDMNEERMQGNRGPFSAALTDALQENLRRGEQSILLLNRRGYQTLWQCCNCYAPVTCPNCSVPMTFHKVNQRLMCHYCGHVQPPVSTCPACGDTHMRQMGFGTQMLEEELQIRLPEARILRMDADTTLSRNAYEAGFHAFARGGYDILAGTQMIGKGLDFPNVTLVGVVSIDKALFAGDYRSYERTFSLITQVVGRGGRGEKVGRAILQTAMPEHYVLQLAARQDYDSFYREEMTLRRSLMFPPVCDLCVIGLSGIWEEAVKAAAARFVELLRALAVQEQFQMPLRVLGPVPATYGRINGKYRYRILLKCKNTAPMRRFVRQLLEQAAAEQAFRKVQVFADMNGDCGV